jgi:transcriptional regulator with XRE-family HTH domain/DNA-directed RNA polymerase subunit RPC12/RpoP
MKCSKCGQEIEKWTPVPRYEYSRLGVPVTLLNAVSEARCPNCETVESTLIPNLNGLIASAAAERVGIPIRLSGQEIRFLRKALNYSGMELAEKLGVRNEAISRYENDAEPMGEHLERLFRTFVYLRLRRYTRIKVKLEHLLTMHFDDSVRRVGVAVPLALRLVHERERAKPSAKKAEGAWQPDPMPLKKTG